MDESQPLLRVPTNEPEYLTTNPTVDFDPNGDPENPIEWPKAYKTGVVALLAFMSFTVTFTCIGVVPIADRIILDLEGAESKSASILLVTVWELGEACGPLLIAPLSEIYGRYPAFNVANLIFIVGVVLSALSPTSSTLVFARFLTGTAVASNVLNPAIIGDIFTADSRGSGMSLIMLAPLVGGAVGPAISGLIADTLGWRKILWISAALSIVCEILFFTLLRETYKVPILKKKAARLRKETNDETLKCPFESDSAATDVFWSELRTSIKRPLAVMLDSGVLMIMSFYGGLMFTFYYILATTLPSILEEAYHFTSAQTGLAFLSLSIGAIGGIAICNATLDRMYISLRKSHGGVARPEFYLPIMIGSAIIMPVFVAFYGWIPDAQWSVYLLLVAVAILGVFLILISISLSSYVVDAFGLYSASAMTVVLIVRCLQGTLLPLAIPPLVDALGLGYGFVFLAGFCLVLVPLPWAVMRYGKKWRQNSIYTRGI